MKILYINTLNYGVSYWRLENYATALLKQPNINVHLEWFIDPRERTSWEHFIDSDIELGEIIRDKLDAAFSFFDVIVIQKLQVKKALEYFKQLKEKYPKVLCIMETDDAIGDINPSHIYINRITEEHNIAAQHAIWSDGIITSTQYLADSMKPFIGDKPIHIAPNCINKDLWNIKKTKRKPSKLPVFAYVAGGGHDEDIKIAYRAFEGYLKRKELILKIRYGGFKPDFIQYGDFKQVEWEMRNYPHKLWNMNADFFIAPLRDTTFNRCKSNLKWIESSSIGVPLIASNVEPFKNTNGTIYLTGNNQDEWEDIIQRALNGELNVTHSKLLKENSKNYNIHKESAKLIEWFKSML